jgi:hypothetical protein
VDTNFSEKHTTAFTFRVEELDKPVTRARGHTHTHIHTLSPLDSEYKILVQILHKHTLRSKESTKQIVKREIAAHMRGFRYIRPIKTVNFGEPHHIHPQLHTMLGDICVCNGDGP